MCPFMFLKRQLSALCAPKTSKDPFTRYMRLVEWSTITLSIVTMRSVLLIIHAICLAGADDDIAADSLDADTVRLLFLVVFLLN